jgi:HD-GYP domain-containing protein (c-di-GMP phosphodiesterase class II)
LSGHCDVAARLGVRLGLDPAVIEALAHAYERWDGRGAPAGLSGRDVPIAVRISAVARDAELWARAAGWPTTVEILMSRSGRAYDPAVVDLVVDHGERWLTGSGDDVCQAVLDAEPSPFATIDDVDLDVALLAVADFADLQSPWLRGHSRAVARLVAVAASAAGLDKDSATTVRRAALVHDLGRVGVPSGIWDRPGPLTAEQFERVRMHAYLTERILARSAVLDPYRAIAARHHERADGSGYHRGETAEQTALAAQLLAAADAYHAMTEARPHRDAMSAAAAADQLRHDVGDGLFTHAAVDAVLAAGGHEPAVRPPEHPAGLTDREVEVLGLIASGHVTTQVAQRLGISPKTLGRHLEHIYTKIDVTTRAGATLFAMEHGLVAR